MVNPKNNLIIPATIFPSINLVTEPQIHDVGGKIARIKLKTLPKPK